RGPAAGEAPPRLPVAEGRHAHGTAAGPQPLGDLRQRQSAALDRGPQGACEGLSTIHLHHLTAMCVTSLLRITSSGRIHGGLMPEAFTNFDKPVKSPG